MRIPVALSTMPPNTVGDPAAGVASVDIPATAAGVLRADRRCRLGRAYRAGRLVCACVHVTVSLDGRLGLAPDERRLVRVRFHEPLDDGLRSELVQLVRRRGAAARRVVERVDPIEVVIDDPYGERQRIVGHLEPPQIRHGRLRNIEVRAEAGVVSEEPRPRLSGDQVMALKFAAHRQLARWSNKPKLSPHQHGQRFALKSAVLVLQDQAFARGCELRVPDTEDSADD